MKERDLMSLSENDITPEPEEPTPGTVPGEEETPPQEEGQDPVTEPEIPPAEEGQDPGENTVPPEQQPPAQETGSGEGSIPEKDLQELIDSISARFEQKDADIEELTESIRSLVDLMSTGSYQQGDVYVPPEIMIEGYEEWDYPITVDYMINIVGYEEMLPQSADYDNPEQFLEDFQDMAWNCYLGTVFKDFYIDKIYDAGGGKVYDSQGMEEPEPDPGEEEPNETVELLLSRLEGINTTLGEMQQAELEYYQAVAAYQEEMLKLQTAHTGSTIILCIAVFAVFAELIMKHFLEGFR